MKYLLLLNLLLSTYVFEPLNAANVPIQPQVVDEYSTSVTFPATFAVGDYNEFVEVNPTSAGSSGYYLISISYVRGGIAASATHLASISHYNPSIWREVGRINNNGYVSAGQNFTIDCNTDRFQPRFRVRAINTIGSLTPMVIEIRVKSININNYFVPLNTIGNDTTVDKFLPMTNEWDLYVGNPYYADGASIAIKALANGNVGIGTATPTEKLSVNGKIRAKEIKVETTNWPDYVFEPTYKQYSIAELEAYIKINKRLPEMPSAKEAEANGIALGEMNKILLKKIEELTLYLIEKDKQLAQQDHQIKQIKDEQALMKQQLLKRIK
jgi:hypothetical protein